MEINMPCDEEGFVDLQCHLCGEHFKLLAQNINDESNIDIWCPYCGLNGQIYASKDVEDVALKMAVNEMNNLIFNAFKDIEKSIKHNKNVKFKAGKKPKDEVINTIKSDVVKKEGSILNIPYEDEKFDCVFICEALEHCIDLDNAIDEIYRVLKPDGKVIIIDKNIKSLGQLELADFEQWFDEKELCKKLERIGFKAEVKSNLEYEGGKRDGLFSAWIGERK